MIFYSVRLYPISEDGKGSNTEESGEITRIIDTDGFKKVSRIAYLRSLT